MNRPALLAAGLWLVAGAAATAAAAAAVAREPGPGFGAVYAALAPSAGLGLAVGEADRLAAHRAAEAQCNAGPGSNGTCRMLAEFAEPCAAAAQGVVRSPWALLMTSSPDTQVVTSAAAGSGATPEAAEAAALAECHARDPRARCRIILAACRRTP
jgi:hypothetical protein